MEYGYFLVAIGGDPWFRDGVQHSSTKPLQYWNTSESAKPAAFHTNLNVGWFMSSENITLWGNGDGKSNGNNRDQDQDQQQSHPHAAAHWQHRDHSSHLRGSSNGTSRKAMKIVVEDYKAVIECSNCSRTIEHRINDNSIKSTTTTTTTPSGTGTCTDVPHDNSHDDDAVVVAVGDPPPVDNPVYLLPPRGGDTTSKHKNLPCHHPSLKVMTMTMSSGLHFCSQDCYWSFNLDDRKHSGASHPAAKRKVQEKEKRLHSEKNNGSMLAPPEQPKGIEHTKSNMGTQRAQNDCQEAFQKERKVMSFEESYVFSFLTIDI